jgi:hypothetical protein
VKARRSPVGSPTQTIAVLSPLPAAIWASRQATEAFVVPPVNQVATGGRQSSTFE